MFCKYCGKEINDKASICIHCGCATGSNSIEENLTGESKKGLGILMGIFLGLIGLIVGICLYPANSIERKTFIKGWAIAFAITFVAILVLNIVGIVGASCLMSNYYYY